MKFARLARLWHPCPCLTPAALAASLVGSGVMAAHGAVRESAAPPTLAIQVEHSILLFGDPPGTVPSTKLSVEPLSFPPGATLTYHWRQIQDVLSPAAAEMRKGKRIVFAATNAANTIASFPSWGVYEIRLTVTALESGLSESRNVWVSVWDAQSQLVVNGQADPLGAAPGIKPPTSVRNLKPAPGPFVHPRIYCSDADWPEIRRRCTEGLIASSGLRQLEAGLRNEASGINSAKSDYFKLTAALAAYADAKYQSVAPDLTGGISPEIKDGKPNWENARRKLLEYQRQLRDACFAAWIKNEPSKRPDQLLAEDLAQRRRLAKAVSGLCHLLLCHSWDRQTGEFKHDYPLYIPRLHEIGLGLQEFQYLALAYDFSAHWMTPEEQRETRNLLFAVGVGRTTGARNFVPQVNGVWQNHGVERGPQQNGDFMNIEEEKIITALCLAGEESGVNPEVIQTFTAAPKPKDYETSGQCFPYDWTHFTEFDGGRNHPASQPYPEGGNWPFARKVEVDNLQRAIWFNDDWYVSPWGFLLNKEAYYGFSAYGLWPAAVAYARAGAFNQYVAGHYYHTLIHNVYSYYPGALPQKSEHFSSNIYLYDHHDGGSDYRHVHALFLKYMYPDDPLVDYFYAPYAVSIEQRPHVPFFTALFGLDPGINGSLAALPETAKAKALPVTKLDPQIGVVVARSGWSEEDMMLYFDAGWSGTGHMHAAKNSFAFFALGRPWAISPGYHQKLNNFYSTVMIQDPAWAQDPLTQGYIGQSESAEPAGSDYPTCHPTPPGHLLEVRESADKLYTLMAGDARTAYDFCYARDNQARPQITQPWTRADHMYPGLLDFLLARLPDAMNREMFTGKRNIFGLEEKINPGYNPVRYAFRTILFVRGTRPYALVVDDINKDDAPRNYRWMMNCSYDFGGADGRFADENGKAVGASMTMAPNATPTEAILVHLPDQGEQPGLPRLLVRDLSETDNRTQPPLRLDRTTFGTPYSHHTDRIFIDRVNVPEPKYKILLFPYRTGERLPVTAWDSLSRTLTINLRDGTTDQLEFDRTNPDHRTRLTLRRTKTGLTP